MQLPAVMISLPTTSSLLSFVLCNVAQCHLVFSGTCNLEQCSELRSLSDLILSQLLTNKFILSRQFSQVSKIFSMSLAYDSLAYVMMKSWLAAVV